eukprot:2287685-Rhodomonas_salina.1
MNSSQTYFLICALPGGGNSSNHDPVGHPIAVEAVLLPRRAARLLFLGLHPRRRVCLLSHHPSILKLLFPPTLLRCALANFKTPNQDSSVSAAQPIEHNSEALPVTRLAGDPAVKKLIFDAVCHHHSFLFSAACGSVCLPALSAAAADFESESEHATPAAKLPSSAIGVPTPRNSGFDLGRWEFLPEYPGVDEEEECLCQHAPRGGVLGRVRPAVLSWLLLPACGAGWSCSGNRVRGGGDQLGKVKGSANEENHTP